MLNIKNLPIIISQSENYPFFLFYVNKRDVVLCFYNIIFDNFFKNCWIIMIIISTFNIQEDTLNKLFANIKHDHEQ